MSVAAAIALLAFLVLGNYWLSRSTLYPPFLFAAMWFLVLGLYKLDLTPVDELHPETILIIGIGALLFSMGGLLGLYLPRSLFTARLILTRFPQRNNIVKPAVTLFLLCGIPVLLRNFFALAATGVGNTVFQRARTGGTLGGAPDVNPLGTYFILWSYYAATLYLLERRDKSFWLMTAIAFAAGLMSTGRLPIMMLICSLTCAQLMLTGRHNFWGALKFVRVPMLLFFIMYFGLIFVNKDTSVFETTSVEQLLLIFFVGYIVGPAAALDFFLQHPNNYPEAPNHTFKFFLGIAAHFHLLPSQVPPVESHITVPFPTNVYTVYRSYISDFGLYGALAVMFVIGLLHTMIYRKARTGSRLGIYFFSVTLYETLMVIFSDEYASFGAYIDMVLFAAIYIVLRSLKLRILPQLESGYGVPAHAD